TDNTDNTDNTDIIDNTENTKGLDDFSKKSTALQKNKYESTKSQLPKTGEIRTSYMTLVGYLFLIIGLIGIKSIILDKCK
ncbi:LPXTG cell wall anchor domain-containing protein, partial [Enterococcus faecalis]|uniref:LPXTG cell wall anchor domain-containing protein n=1 Tax=Enterococcus faecalis TaxID=1351 RepID=UPI000354491E